MPLKTHIETPPRAMGGGLRFNLGSLDDLGMWKYNGKRNEFVARKSQNRNTCSAALRAASDHLALTDCTAGDQARRTERSIQK